MHSIIIIIIIIIIINILTLKHVFFIDIVLSYNFTTLQYMNVFIDK